uniref:Uncharacterized protein n=1 Tax=Arundo donax TaxID=35708 RepID=A0A0A9D1L6_ARUDO
MGARSRGTRMANGLTRSAALTASGVCGRGAHTAARLTLPRGSHSLGLARLVVLAAEGLAASCACGGGGGARATEVRAWRRCSGRRGASRFIPLIAVI